MNISVIIGHLTATDKRMVRFAIQNQLADVTCGKREMRLELIAPDTYTVRTSEQWRDDYGQKITRKYHAEIRVKHDAH